MASDRCESSRDGLGVRAQPLRNLDRLLAARVRGTEVRLAPVLGPGPLPFGGVLLDVGLDEGRGRRATTIALESGLELFHPCSQLAVLDEEPLKRLGRDFERAGLAEATHAMGSRGGRTQ